MIKIAVLGYGTVGSGVVEVINTNAGNINKGVKDIIEVKYILDIRDFPDSPFAGRFIKDFTIIENDPEISVVVETIGGTGVAYEFTKRCLNAGKNVVTSNKELVATRGFELLSIAKQNNLNYLFEASVGGGIPIIRPITQCLAANQITGIYGILNGTTNYILTRMMRAGANFTDALAEAKEKGYAEADSTSDIEGKDACRKICILSALAFGRHVYPQYVHTEGIGSVSKEDAANADAIGRRIKLLGYTQRTGDGRVFAYVAPHMVSVTSPIATVDDVFNAIVVEGNAIDEVMFYGRGAGKLPTASAVVADVMDAAKHFKARKYLDWEDSGADYVADYRMMSHRFYVRCKQKLSADQRKSAERYFKDIEYIGKTGHLAETAFTTALMRDGAFEQAIQEFGQYAEVANTMRLFK